LAPKTCLVSFTGPSGIRHSISVEAESLYEAAVLAVTRFRKNVWGEQVGSGIGLDIEVREASAVHSLTLHQVERWLAGITASPAEASKKAKLSLILVQGIKSIR
jgi:hypothetical protein